MKRLPLFFVIKRETTKKIARQHLLEMLNIAAGLIHKWLQT
jgi:hypothetical protein